MIGTTTLGSVSWKMTVAGGLVAGLAVVAAGGAFFGSGDEAVQKSVQASAVNSDSGVNCCIFDGSTLSCRIIAEADRHTCNQDFSFTKTADVAMACPGDMITYTIDYKNLSGETLSTITIEDDYNQEHAMVETIPSNCSDNGDKLDCGIGSLDYLAEGSFQYTLKIKGTPLTGAEYAQWCS